MTLPKKTANLKKKLNSRQFSTEDFIKEARKVHKDRFNYEKTRFIDKKTKVKIRCKLHGVFEQMPENHLVGKGCPQCGRLKASNSNRLTLDQFIKKAKKIHGDRYSYDKAVYHNNSTPIEIICAEHGSFLQRPAQHLVGSGCSICSAKRGADAIRKTREQFIKEARKIHGRRYSYNLVEYKNDKTKIWIECSIHGKFSQYPGNHLKGNGCPECARLQRPVSKRRSIEQFIKEAREVHKGRYSYDKAIYRSSSETIDITCPEHGVFSQIAENHLSGSGCPKCNKDKMADLFRKPYEQFVKDARSVHGNRYAYHKVKYRKNSIPVTIVCQIHGEFKKAPSDHLDGFGCRACSKEALRIKRQAHFLAKAREMHGNRYDYSLLYYVNSRTHVTIICPVHGPFRQRPDGHLEGKHCRECHLDLVKRGYYKSSGPKSLLSTLG